MQFERPVQFDNNITILNIPHSKNEHQLRMLIHLSTIINHQLPLMPQEHINNLLFESSHQNLIAIKNEEVIGGVCFIVWQQKMLCELSLMALTSNHQQKGHGTTLVNHLKNLLQKMKVVALVTNADNNALEFYRKQGFTPSQILLPQTYHNPISYSNSTLMSFKITPNTNYIDYQLSMSKQHNFVKENLKYMSKYKKYQLDFTNSLQPYSYKKKGKEYHYQINPVFIEGLIANGWTPQELEQMNNSQEMQQCQSKMRQNHVLQILYDQALPYIRQFPKELELSQFNQPPIDLRTIQIKLQQNQYHTNMEFVNDIKLVFSNCIRLYSTNNPLLNNIQKLTQSLQEMRNKLQP